MEKKQIKKPNFKIDEITLVVIVVAIAVFVSFYEHYANPKGAQAEKISSMILTDQNIGFATGGVINQKKFVLIQEMDYKQLKDYLKIKDDFCIYIQDGNGTVILSKGSSKLSNDGISCKEQ